MATFAAFAESFSTLPFARAARRDAASSKMHALPKSRFDAMAYTHALVALAAKLAAVDGTVNKAEYMAYNELVPPSEAFDSLRLRSLFMKHLGDHASALQYARQIAAMTAGDAQLHETLLLKLLRLATADTVLNAPEMELLRAISDSFGISREQFKALVAQVQVPQVSPYEILGVTPETGTAETRLRYLALVQKLHPDRYQGAGASDETMAMLSGRLAELNAAYDTIKRSHAKKSTKAGAAVARWWAVRNTKDAKAS